MRVKGRECRRLKTARAFRGRELWRRTCSTRPSGSQQPVIPIQNEAILEVDEVSGDEDGGSELSDVEDVFVGGEAELPKKV